MTSHPQHFPKKLPCFLTAIGLRFYMLRCINQTFNLNQKCSRTETLGPNESRLCFESCYFLGIASVLGTLSSLGYCQISSSGLKLFSQITRLTELSSVSFVNLLSFVSSLGSVSSLSSLSSASSASSVDFCEFCEFCEFCKFCKFCEFPELA